MKPLKETIFRVIEGKFASVSGDSGTLADYLQELGLIIDDKCEFARFKDYEKGVSIWYKATTNKVIITTWKI